MMTTDMYRKMMQEATATHTVEQLDFVNKEMLAKEQITTEQYLMIARGLAQHMIFGKPIKF